MNNELIFYTTPDGNKKVEVVFQDETAWLKQKALAELFGVEVNTVNYHLKEIFKSSELVENSVIRKIRTTAADGKGFATKLPDEDSVISILETTVAKYELMQFCISDTFTDSFVKLTGEEQKAVKTTAFDLQLNSANPGMQFHKHGR